MPFWFDYGTSSVILSGSSTPTASGTREVEETSIKLVFTGLPGLEEQLEQLSRCVERVNRHVEERYRHLAGCVPILLHGSTG